ncbi:hypothetical protein PFICI_08711 [Pestalotiopsis fici W106-1]|uniref:AA1-like domain-containing protein n=1 Tax=Pestalotiopsis fici (strain W106-1 / CGMCC3.15140) TaxID=1229662 RepID=W3WYA4_PESFW|nr:uncharacterized protein PFICI_08711 [Pestalotiopsis fici W106-1]ETS78858.1 hypothetical protein PFICI_08711 [Pestalotiopsis fici W106-1]
MLAIKNQLAAVGLAMLSVAPAFGSAPQAADVWTITGFSASYTWENNRTASIDFDLFVPNTADGAPNHCSIAIPGLEAILLPNVTDANCDRVGYKFDFTLYTMTGGLYSGADLCVYGGDSVRRHYISDGDFVLVPYYEEDGTEHPDIEYRGASEFDLDMA